jgi:hypothetical protein
MDVLFGVTEDGGGYGLCFKEFGHMGRMKRQGNGIAASIMWNGIQKSGVWS